MNPLNHVAIIMDGNGRWGLKYKKSRNAGHKAGLNTVEKVIKETIKQKIKRYKIKINEKNLEKHLQTKNIPNPDILIRTGNTKRLSNFLLWQLAYSEIFFEKKLWPAFTEKDFIKIIKEYKNTKRNFGKIWFMKNYKKEFLVQ